MFEEKIQLNVTKVNNIVTKKIHGQEIKFNKYLDQTLCEVVIKQCIEQFTESNEENKNFINAINDAIKTMNISLCYLTTNLDISHIAYDDLYIMGIFKAIEETLINYNEIKSIILTSIGIMYDHIIYNVLEQLPTSKGMIDSIENIKEVFQSNPEKAKEFTNVVAANHPEIKGFGEMFSKFLNNLEKKN